MARVYTYTLENNLIISGVIKHGGPLGNLRTITIAAGLLQHG